MRFDRVLFAMLLAGSAFAGDSVAQNQACAVRCQAFFSQCLQVCGSNCTTAGISAAITSAASANAANPNTSAANAVKSPTVFRNCDGEQSLCLITCQSSPNG